MNENFQLFERPAVVASWPVLTPPKLATFSYCFAAFGAEQLLLLLLLSAPTGAQYDILCHPAFILKRYCDTYEDAILCMGYHTVWLAGWWYNIEDPAITLKRYYDTYETKI